jgi:hypothetical protein
MAIPFAESRIRKRRKEREECLTSTTSAGGQESRIPRRSAARCFIHRIGLRWPGRDAVWQHRDVRYRSWPLR